MLLDVETDDECFYGGPPSKADAKNVPKHDHDHSLLVLDLEVSYLHLLNGTVQ